MTSVAQSDSCVNNSVSGATAASGLVSAELHAANQRLLSLRAQTRARRDAEAVTQTNDAETDTLALPSHLGWGSAAQTRVLRRSIAASKQPDDAPAPARERPLHQSGPVDVAAESLPTTAASATSIRVFPSILVGMLKAEQASAGRVWLLCRHMDRQGRGWLHVDEVRQKLTRKRSPLRICGWRRLRQLLRQGQGVFWQRDDRDRLWLRGAAKTALALNVDTLQGRAVDLPLTALLQGMQTVRAHFYAAFHSGRKTAPISRVTLERTTGVPSRTQRRYDEVAGVSRRRNMVVGERHSAEAAREQAWRRGGAVFPFIDSGGRQGPKNRCYIAWHLPNSYEGPHEQRGRRRQKEINRQLTDLAHNGTRGNGQERVERVFWPTGGAAARAHSKQATPDLYWPQGAADRRVYALWHVMAVSVVV